MDSTIKSRWLEALRSGDYDQGHYYLHAVDDETGKESYCCLGVLCKIALDEGIAQAGEPNRSFCGSDDKYYTHIDYADADVENLGWGYCTGALPRSVAVWAGLDSRNPEIEKDGGDVRTLAGLNDEGCTFAEIADLIEEQL